jgi:hypothetical protein
VVPAFSHLWSQHSPDVPWEYCVKHDWEMKHISKLHDVLVLPIGCDPESITEDKLRVKLIVRGTPPTHSLLYLYPLSSPFSSCISSAVCSDCDHDQGHMM